MGSFFQYIRVHLQGRWTNGYTTEHNVRTKANAIRQQMLQNSQNWHTAGTQAERDYLHQQNLELNRILSQYAGGVESGYDPATAAGQRKTRISATATSIPTTGRTRSGCTA